MKNKVKKLTVLGLVSVMTLTPIFTAAEIVNAEGISKDTVVINSEETFNPIQVYSDSIGFTGDLNESNNSTLDLDISPQHGNILTAKYVDKTTGASIEKNYVIRVNEGESYQVPQKMIEGYTFESSSESLSGTMGRKDKKITLYYLKESISEYELIAKYLDKETGESISSDYVSNVRAGEEYSVPQESIIGYTFESSSESLTGTMGANDKEISLYYTKDPLPEHRLTAKYVDKATGESIGSDYIVSVKEGEEYSLLKESIVGYTFDSSSEPLSGTMGTQDKEISLYYTKDPLPEHNLTAKYVDKITGETINEDYRSSIREGEAYSIPQENITGYTFESSSESLTGIMGVQDKEITLYYTKDPLPEHRLTAKYIDKATGESISEKYTSPVREGEAYSIPQENITGYTFESSSESLTGIMGTKDKEITLYYIKNTQGTITANTFNVSKDRYINGGTTGDVAKIAVEIDGVIKQRIPKKIEETYEYFVGSQISKTDQEVWMIAYDTVGKELDRTKVRLIKETGEFKFKPYKIGKHSYIEGSYTGDITKIKLIVDGKDQSKISVFNGELRYYSARRIHSVDQHIIMVGYGENNNELAREKIELIDGDGLITTDDHKVGYSYVRGETTGDIVKMLIRVNGVDYVKIPSNGSFQYYIKGKINSSEDVVEAIGLDRLNREIDSTPVKVIDEKGTIEVDTYKVGSAYITGKSTGDVSKVTVSLNGKKLSSIPAGIDGTFKYYVGSKITSSQDEVTILGQSRLNDLDSKSLSIEDAFGAIVVDDHKVGSSYIRGKTVGDVARVSLEIDGREYQTIPVTDGAFNYYVAGKGITEISNVKVIGKDNNANPFTSTIVSIIK